MRRPVWIALPVAALLLGATLFELASSPGRSPVSKPEPARLEVPSGHVADGPLVLPLDESEVFIRAETAPRIIPPFVPAADGENVVRTNWDDGTCQRRFELIRESVEYNFVATITDVATNGCQFTCETFVGECPSDDAQFFVYDENGKQLMECRLFDFDITLEGKNFDQFKETYVFMCTEAPAKQEVRQGFTIKPSGEHVWMHGLYQRWHENGVGACEGRYKLDERDGDWIWWHDNETVAATGLYDKGKRVGTWRLWYDDGARHAVWVEADAANEFRGWQVWTPDGELDPCYGSELRELVNLVAQCVTDREYTQAQEHLSALGSLVVDIPDGRSRESMSYSLERVQSNLDRILAAESDDEREGERLLLKFTELGPLQRSLNYSAPRFPR